MPNAETVPACFQSFFVRSGEITVDNMTYVYHVLSPAFEPRMPGFCGFTSGAFLWILENAPPESMDHMLRHEVRETMSLRGVKDRCLECLRLELRDVEDTKRRAHMEYRLEYFERLAAYLQRIKLAIEEEEVQGSVAHLKKLLCK